MHYQEITEHYVLREDAFSQDTLIKTKERAALVQRRKRWTIKKHEKRMIGIFSLTKVFFNLGLATQTSL